MIWDASCGNLKLMKHFEAVELASWFNRQGKNPDAPSWFWGRFEPTQSSFHQFPASYCLNMMFVGISTNTSHTTNNDFPTKKFMIWWDSSHGLEMFWIPINSQPARYWMTSNSSCSRMASTVRQRLWGWI